MGPTNPVAGDAPAPNAPARGISPPGYRLPAATRLGIVRLQVADLARSLPYYERVLGLHVLGRSGGVARLAARGDTTALIELHERPGAAPVPRRGRLGLYHFAILVPDRAALGGFVRHLAEAGVQPGMSDHLVSEAIYLTDPDGLGIEVYADRPRSTWRYDGSQLVMATAPLDVGDLLRAAGGAVWSGMPAGSVIGHVHLFVGDLKAAAAFYHAALGFDKVVWSYPGALFLSAGGYHHHLGTNTWAAGAAPAGEGDARLLEWEIVLPALGDVTAAAESLTKAGAAVERVSGGGVARDPWGTVVRLRAATL
ncbi:MAG TPA: VOC family protein [Gemmatimonadales bacterium]|nr:VOC family protein [Gemmatimonadales bacterium]